jgi:hypothetical protein
MLLLLMCCDREVADRGMTTAIKLLRAHTLTDTLSVTPKVVGVTAHLARQCLPEVGEFPRLVRRV